MYNSHFHDNSQLISNAKTSDFHELRENIPAAMVVIASQVESMWWKGKEKRAKCNQCDVINSVHDENDKNLRFVNDVLRYQGDN